jgi:hypothetical protein
VFEAGANIKFEANLGGKYYANAPLETRSDIDGKIHCLNTNCLIFRKSPSKQFCAFILLIEKKYSIPSKNLLEV